MNLTHIRKAFFIPRRKLSACLLVSFASFFTIAGYECIRSVTIPIFIHFYGVKNLPLITILIPFATFAFIYFYGLTLNLLNPRQTLVFTILFSALYMVGCQQALVRDVAIASSLLLIFQSSYIVVIIEQFWSFINSILTISEAKRLNGLWLGISSLGGIAGAFLAKKMAITYGSNSSPLVTALLMIPVAILSYAGYRLIAKPYPNKRAQGEASGTSLVLRSSFLRKIAAIVLLSQIIAGLLSLKFWEIASIHISGTDAQSAYQANLFLIINSLAMFFQFVLAPLAGLYLSLKSMLLFIPAINAVMAGALLLIPSLPIASASIVVFKVLDYSLFRVSKEPLYIPLSFDERYRAKQVIDSFVYRLAKGGLSGALITGWSRVFAFAGLRAVASGGSAIMAMIASCLWIFTANALSREHRRLSEDHLRGESI